MAGAMTNPDLRRKIKVKARTDLVINKQQYRGQYYYIVKDPVSLKYFRFREEELFLLRSLDGQRTLDDIRHEFVEHFRPQRISVPDLEKFVNQLLQSGIATADIPNLGIRLHERCKKRKNDKIREMFTNILYLKVPVFDPEPLLERMLPYTRFMFTKVCLVCMMLLGLAAGLLVLVNWNQFISKLPSYQEFFTWRSMIYLWVTLAVVKVIHEFGHGLSCKRFGGEVHEMGFLFLVLSPALYCNVTDAWMLPNKWHRAAIGAAGMYFELILASLFTFVWWYTEPGLLNQLSLSIIFICGVSTVLFNANPLMRFDGYYILSDLMEIPNLRERSNKYLGNLASRIFLGKEFDPDPYLPTRLQWLFVGYAVFAYFYRCLVTFGILYFLYTFLKPYKLAVISALLATLAVIPLAALPIIRIYKALKGKWRTLKVNKLRMAASVFTVLAVLAALALLPLPMRIDVPMILQPRDAVSLFVKTPGTLWNLNIKDGELVGPGRSLGQLYDPERERDFDRLRLQYEQHTKMELSFRASGDLSSARRESLQADAARRMMDNLSRQMGFLNLTAPPGVNGIAFLPPKMSDLGKSFKAGDLFCQVGDPKRLKAYMVVEHSDVPLIEEARQRERPVWLKLYGHVGPVLRTRIDRIGAQEINDLPQSLSNKFGGEVATSSEPESKREIPQSKSYAVEADLPNDDGSLMAGIRGTARVDVGYYSIYWRVKRYLQQTFHFRM